MLNILKRFTKERLREYLEPKRNKLFIGHKPAMSYAVRKLTLMPPLGKGMSMQAIADRAWVDRSYLSKIIDGLRHPKKYAWFRIGLAGGYDVGEMVRFMRMAGYVFDEENLVDVLLLYCMGQGMDLAETAAFFLCYKDMGIDEEVHEEVFGKSKT